MDQPVEKPSMSPEIAKAIISVMSEVKILAKGDKNTQGNYKFASVDDMYEAIRPLLVKANLAILQNEASIEIIEGQNKKGEASVSLKAVYDFTYVHSSGATYGPLRRSVMVYQAAAQSFGSAQSYAMKYFLRGEFKIATGDDDDEGTQKESLSSVRRATATGDSLEDQVKSLAAAMERCKDADALDALMTKNVMLLERVKDANVNVYDRLMKREQSCRDRTNTARDAYEAVADDLAKKPAKPTVVSPELVQKGKA